MSASAVLLRAVVDLPRSTCQCVATTTQTMSRGLADHVSPSHPLWWTQVIFLAPSSLSVSPAGSGGWGTPRAVVDRVRGWTGTSSFPPAAVLERWRVNVARLYARRILDMAMASAATQRYLAQLDQGIVLEEGPELNHHKTWAEPFRRKPRKEDYAPPAAWKEWTQRKDWTDELLQSLGSSPWQRWWAAFYRACSLTVLAAPLTVLIPVSYISEPAKDLSWSYSLWAIEQAGPTFVKLAQWATTRQDLFSTEFCQYFGALRDQTRGHAWPDTQRILQQDLSEQVLDQIMDLQPQPIGSGCIAQVYRGRLKHGAGQFPAGTEIAVKVQHPGIWHKVCVDFFILAKMAAWLEDLPYLNLRYLSLSDTVAQFRNMMLPQLDLSIEAQNLQRFNRDFSSDERVSFPHPIHALTTPRVLTETFCHGTPIMEYTKESLAVRRDLAHLGLITTLKMIFQFDFLHGDLHPGNVLVGRNRYNQLQLHLLDCGLVVEMGPEQHVNLVKILGAFTRMEGRLAGQLMVDTSSDCQASDVDMELFVTGIERICDDEANLIEKVGDYIADVCYLACKHKVKLEASFINAALAVEIMEGIATALYPDLHVGTIAMPLVVQAEIMHRLPKLSIW